MIRWFNCFGQIPELVAKLNEEGLKKENIVHISERRFNADLNWYTVIYEVADT